MKNRYTTLMLLSAGIVAIIALRALLAGRFAVPHTFQIFDTLTVAGALLILLQGRRDLHGQDWVSAPALDALVGAVEMVVFPIITLLNLIMAIALLRSIRA